MTAPPPGELARFRAIFLKFYRISPHLLLYLHLYLYLLMLLFLLLPVRAVRRRGGEEKTKRDIL